MTHDEASSWLNYHNTPIWSCFFDPRCWGTANNHWLNTLLFQWSAAIFGPETWALRLPNVIAGWAYLFCAYLLCNRYIKTLPLQLLGFMLLCGHVYLLDFFSLARGYGLMTSGVMWAVYSLLRYREVYDNKWLGICLASLLLSVLGNFTGLLAYLSVGIVWLIQVVYSKKYDLLIRHGLVWVLSALILFFLLRLPIQTLSAAGEFTQGADNAYQTGVDLMRSISYGQNYLGPSSVIYFLFFFLGLIVLFLFGAYRKRSSDDRAFLLVSTLLFVSILVIIVQQLLTGSHTPVGRKSIYLVPIFFSAVALGFTVVGNRRMALGIGSVLLLLVSVHFLQKFPMERTREWYYDAYYPELMSVILPEGKNNDSVRLSTSWIFYPALNFYKETVPLPFDDLPYQRPLVIDSSRQYYYVEGADTTGMDAHGYHLHKNIGPYFLYKNERANLFPSN